MHARIYNSMDSRAAYDHPVVNLHCGKIFLIGQHWCFVFKVIWDSQYLCRTESRLKSGVWYSSELQTHAQGQEDVYDKMWITLPFGVKCLSSSFGASSRCPPCQPFDVLICIKGLLQRRGSDECTVNNLTHKHPHNTSYYSKCERKNRLDANLQHKQRYTLLWRLTAFVLIWQSLTVSNINVTPE